MKPPPPPVAPLAHPWFVKTNVFAATAEPTLYLDVLDLLPADARSAGNAVRYQRPAGETVSLAGASLVFENPDDDSTAELTSPLSPHAEGLKELVWQADAELRKVPAVLRGIVRDLRRAAQGRVPGTVLPAAFVAGVVTTLLATWIF